LGLLTRYVEVRREYNYIFKMDIVSEQRFLGISYTVLKKRLDALHYTHPLGLESAALVERLLTDLLKTTEGFQQLKKINDDVKNRLKQAQEAIVPFQTETSRLTKQNNDLHIDLMRVKEDCDSRENAWRASVKKLESECEDLKYLVARAKEDMNDLEQQNLDLRTRLDNAMSKSYLPSTNKGIEPKARREANTIGHTQAFEIARTLKPGSLEMGRVDNEWVGELRQADERNQRLQDQLSKLSREKTSLEEQLVYMKDQVRRRDAELERVSSIVGQTVNLERIQAKYHQDSAVENIQRLNEKIDFLNKENLRLEQELEKAQKILSDTNGRVEQNQGLVNSVAELRAQNQALQKKVLELATLGNELESPSREQLNQSRFKIEELQNQISTLNLEIARLKEDANRSGMIQSAYNSDKKAFTEALDRMAREKERLESDYTNLRNSYNTLQTELINKEDELRLTHTQLSNLKREVEMGQQSLSRINKDHINTTEEYYSLRQKLSSLESLKSMQENEIANLKFEIERVNKLKSSAEQQLDIVRSEALKNKTEGDASVAARQRLQVLLDSAQKELEVIKNELLHLSSLREQDRKAVLDYERRIKELQNQLATSQDNVRVVQKEHSILSDELARKLEELRKAEVFRATLERELAELRPMRIKLDETGYEINKIQEKNAERDLDLNRKKREAEELKEEVNNKNRQVQEMNMYLDKAREEIERLKGVVENLEKDKYSIANGARKAEYLEGDLNNLKKQLENSRENERNLLRQLETAKIELEKSSERIQASLRQAERIANQKSEIESELQSLKQEYESYTSQDSEIKTATIKLEEKAFQSSIQIEELKRQISQEQAYRYRSEDECEKLKKSLAAEKTNVQKLSDQNVQLRSLIEGLENTKEDLLKKLQNSHSDRSTEEQHRSELMKQITSLRKQLADNEQNVAEMHEALKNLDADRDYVQSLLDAKVEENATLHDTFALIQRENSELKDQINSFYSKEGTANKRIEERDVEIRKLKQKIAETEAICEDARRGMMSSTRELQEFQDAVSALTRENSIVNDQLVQVSRDRDKLKMMVEESSKSERLAQQLLRASEREKEDLRLTYSRACEEVERLSHSVSIMSEEQRNVMTHLNSCEQELLNAQQHIQQQDVTISNYLTEIATLERQISSLAHQLEIAERRTKEASEAKDALLKEMTSARFVSRDLEVNREELQRALATLENEKYILDSKVRSLQAEIGSLRAQISHQQERTLELEQLLAREREAMSQMQRTISYPEDRSYLADYKTLRNPGHIEDLQKKLEDQRSTMQDMEVDLIRMKEENNRSKLTLAKSDIKVKELEGELAKTRNLGSSRYSRCEDI
jgi:centrosomal protein CEP135